MCRANLSPTLGTSKPLVSDQAHISGDKPTSPRYDETLSQTQRDDYENLILLCRQCHGIIDDKSSKNEYTIAKLHAIKSEHERWAAEQLETPDDARQIRGDVLANAVDIVVEGLSLNRWAEWTGQLVDPFYRWPLWAAPSFLYEVRPKIHAVIWPGNAESLRMSSELVVDAAAMLMATFSKRSTSDLTSNDLYCDSLEKAIFSYRGDDSKKYEEHLFSWDDAFSLCLAHFSKCVNWFSDTVREHVNPRFRVTDGYFVLNCPPFGEQTGVQKFTATEIARILNTSPATNIAKPWETVELIWEAVPESEFPRYR